MPVPLHAHLNPISKCFFFLFPLIHICTHMQCIHTPVYLHTPSPSHRFFSFYFPSPHPSTCNASTWTCNMSTPPNRTCMCMWICCVYMHMHCMWMQISINKKQKNLTEMGVWTQCADVLAHECVVCSCGWYHSHLVLSIFFFTLIPVHVCMPMHSTTATHLHQPPPSICVNGHYHHHHIDYHTRNVSA